MVNRVLIRIKVVQLLYSYLLSQSEFKIDQESADNPSRDKRYAHRLYIDLLLLILELSGENTAPERHVSPLQGLSHNKTYKSQLAKELRGVFTIREIITQGRGGADRFDPIVAELYAAIAELPAYKSYQRIKTPTTKDDVALWLSIVRNLFVGNKQIEAICRESEDFTLVGYNRALEQVEATLEAYGDNRSLFIDSRNALDESLDEAYTLYIGLLTLMVKITRTQQERQEAAKTKFFPTDEDLHPNTRFVDNKFIKALAEPPQIAEALEEKATSWELDDHLLGSLLDAITASELYKEYMAKPGETTATEDAELWKSILKDIILPSDALAEALESKSIYWNDDLHIMGEFAGKTIRRYAQHPRATDVILLPQYKDDEDRNFGPKLFISAISHYNEYKELIERFVNTERWDAERLAFMDIVIMVTAITEIMDYPAIPLAVSINEYIEIANAYSTPRSGAFINGVLYSVTKYLREEGRLNKS